MVWIAIAAALCSAFCLAFGAHFQSKAVRESVDGLELTLKNAGKVASNKVWMAGLLLMILGMSLNVFALASAPLTVVQPIGAIALVVTAVVNAKETKISMNRPTVMAILSCMIGSVGFVLLAVTATNSNHAVTEEQSHLIELILAGVVVIVGLATVLFHRKLVAIFFIIGAGVLFGFVAVLVRTIAVAVLGIGNSNFLQLPWIAGIAVVVAGLLGSYFVQKAYSKGPPELVIAGLTVIDPIIGIAIGASILGELRPDVPLIVSVLMVVAAGFAIVGVVALSRYHPDVIERRNQSEAEEELQEPK